MWVCGGVVLVVVLGDFWDWCGGCVGKGVC